MSTMMLVIHIGLIRSVLLLCRDVVLAMPGLDFDWRREDIIFSDFWDQVSSGNLIFCVERFFVVETSSDTQ
jgi:hypothetical protein